MTQEQLEKASQIQFRLRGLEQSLTANSTDQLVRSLSPKAETEVRVIALADIQSRITALQAEFDDL